MRSLRKSVELERKAKQVSRTGSCFGGYRAETLRPVRIGVTVFDKWLNVPVVRWMLGFIRAISQTCKVHIADSRYAASLTPSRGNRFQTRV